MQINSRTVTTNLFWRFMERCGAQGVTFVVSIILARLLDPEVYGTIALVTVFITILQVFVDSGFGNALIQKKDADDTDFSTVFYFNIAFSGLLYLIIFLVAPLIAKFYENEALIPIIRVLSLNVLISGVKNVQQSYVSKKLIFKKFFIVTISASIISAVVGIAMAYYGFGVWALVAQTLSSSLVSTIILWFTVRWRPKLLFSFSRLKGLFSFGWKLLASSLLDTIYNNLRSLIIGKMYTSNDLAFYNKGKQFPHLIVTNINSSIDSVLLPTMSAMQDSREAVKAMTRRAIKTSTYIMMPMMMGLAVCAEPIVELLLTEKWLPCVPYLRIFCFTYAFYPIHTANLNAIKAMGRSDLFLKLEVIKKAVGLVFLLSSMWFGVMAMAYTLLITSITAQIINSWPNKKTLDYSYLEQLKDMLPQILLTVVMGVGVFALQFLNLAPIITLVIQVIIGIIIYVFGSLIFKIESFNYILSIINKFLNKG